METIKLNVEPRDKHGKGAARQLRSAGKAPAVFYGKDVGTLSVTVSPKELMEAVSGDMGINSLLGVELDGKQHVCLLADYQVHPVSRELLHADFMKVDDTRKVNVQVPLEFVGRAKGIVMGGRLRQVYRKLPVTCLPSNIPAKLTHDVSDLDIEDIVRVRDLQLPEGVEVRYAQAQTLGGVYGSRKKATDEEDEKAEGAKAEAKK